ncbi:MAG: hypothetical protein ACRDWS_02560 [Acidimicrobiia bacterium]
MDLIPVKKSTLATWCRDVKLTAEQYDAIRQRTGSREGIPRNTNRKRRGEIEQIRATAKAEIPMLVTDPFWVAGTILYWAEGAKTRNQLALNNTDPRALRMFVTWLRSYIDPNADFSLQLHLHEGNDEAAAMRYWKAETGLDHAKFHRTCIKPAGTGHRKNHLEHGVCTVRMRRAADGWNTVMAWIESLPEHFGLDRPAF